MRRSVVLASRSRCRFERRSDESRFPLGIAIAVADVEAGEVRLVAGVPVPEILVPPEFPSKREIARPLWIIRRHAMEVQADAVRGHSEVEEDAAVI